MCIIWTQVRLCVVKRRHNFLAVPRKCIGSLPTVCGVCWVPVKKRQNISAYMCQKRALLQFLVKNHVVLQFRVEFMFYCFIVSFTKGLTIKNQLDCCLTSGSISATKSKFNKLHSVCSGSPPPQIIKRFEQNAIVLIFIRDIKDIN